MKTNKYYQKPVTVGPGKKVTLFYMLYSPEGRILARIDKEEDAKRVLEHLNARLDKESV